MLPRLPRGPGRGPPYQSRRRACGRVRDPVAARPVRVDARSSPAAVVADARPYFCVFSNSAREDVEVAERGSVEQGTVPNLNEPTLARAVVSMDVRALRSRNDLTSIDLAASDSEETQTTRGSSGSSVPLRKNPPRTNRFHPSRFHTWPGRETRVDVADAARRGGAHDDSGGRCLDLRGYVRARRRARRPLGKRQTRCLEASPRSLRSNFLPAALRQPPPQLHRYRLYRRAGAARQSRRELHPPSPHCRRWRPGDRDPGPKPFLPASLVPSGQAVVEYANPEGFNFGARELPPPPLSRLAPVLAPHATWSSARASEARTAWDGERSRAQVLRQNAWSCRSESTERCFGSACGSFPDRVKLAPSRRSDCSSAVLAQTRLALATRAQPATLRAARC